MWVLLEAAIFVGVGMEKVVAKGSSGDVGDGTLLGDYGHVIE